MNLLQQTNLPEKIAAVRRGPARLLLGIVCVVAVVAASATVWASTVLKLDLESLVANSEQIVDGRVTKVQSKVEDGKVYTYTTVNVEEGMKGATTGETVTIKQLGGRTDELATWVPGVPHFQDGERVIVFLEKPARDALPVVTGMSQGKFRVSLGPDNITPYVVPYLGNIALMEPAQPQVNGSQALSPGDGVGNYQPALPADLYKRVVPLDVFKQNVREVIRGQGEE